MNNFVCLTHKELSKLKLKYVMSTSTQVLNNKQQNFQIKTNTSDINYNNNMVSILILTRIQSDQGRQLPYHFEQRASPPVLKASSLVQRYQELI